MFEKLLLLLLHVRGHQAAFSARFPRQANPGNIDVQIAQTLLPFSEISKSLLFQNWNAFKSMSRSKLEFLRVSILRNSG